jgi:hypothetical protein
VNWLVVKNGAPADTMRITSAGNVGIGTSSPTGDGTALHVNGSSFATLHLTNSTTGAAAGDGFDIVMDGSEALLRNRESAAMKFATAGTERMRIDSSGNLIVGTTTVVGTMIQIDNISGSSSSSKLGIFGFGSGLGFGIIFRPAIDTAATPVLFENAAGAEVGSISTSTGTSNAYVTSSD